MHVAHQHNLFLYSVHVVSLLALAVQLIAGLAEDMVGFAPIQSKCAICVNWLTSHERLGLLGCMLLM